VAWWPMAARQLYRCGGPPVFMPMLRGDSQGTREQRSQLLAWLGIPEPVQRRTR